MKTFQKIVLYVLIFLSVQLSVLNDEVFASSEKSQVGITFKGELPKDPSTLFSASEKNQVTKKEEKTRFPQTNDRSSFFLEWLGFLTLVIGLWQLFTVQEKKEGTTVKKIILTTVLLSTSFLMGALTVHADDLSGKSTAKIGLTKQDPDHPVGPIDPLDPDDNPSSNQPTGNTGDLRIDYISNIDFGTQMISGKTETYQATAPANMVEAQISDLRGTGAGWNLQVNYDPAQSGFSSADQTLKGAELTLPVGQTKTVADSQSAAPATNEITVNDDAQNIMSAVKDTGLGTWADEMTTSQVKLKVPSGNLAGAYTATLVWTLTDAPA